MQSEHTILLVAEASPGCECDSPLPQSPQLSSQTGGSAEVHELVLNAVN